MLDDDDVRTLAEAGAAAPTGGNTQPWRLRATGGTLEVSLDGERSGAFIDVDRSSSLLGIGSFVENVAVAARARGLEPAIELLGLPRVDAPVARISFERRDAIGESATLAVQARSTNRRRWNGETIDRQRIERVSTETEADGSHRLVAVCGEAKSSVAEALAEADVVRTFNRVYMDEMLSEFRWTAEEAEATRDGIDLATLDLSDGDRRGLRLMRRRWFVSLFLPRARIRGMGRKALLESSHLAAVVMPRDARPEQLVAAGRAVQRTWLAATQEGLAVQPWCVIPFFQLRAERYPDSLPERDVHSIEQITASLRDAWGVGNDERLIFTFRMSIPDGPPSELALRRAWTDFTAIERE